MLHLFARTWTLAYTAVSAMRSGMQGPERVQNKISPKPCTGMWHNNFAEEWECKRLKRNSLRSIKATKRKTLEDPSNAKDSVFQEPSSTPLTSCCHSIIYTVHRAICLMSAGKSSGGDEERARNCNPHRQPRHGCHRAAAGRR